MNNKMTRRMFGAAGCALALAVTASVAQQPERVRIRGTIEKVDGQVLTVKSREGANLTVNMADNVRLTATVKASLADIKPGNYVGVSAQPQADGSQKAIAIHIFRDSQRGTGEGHGPWDLEPGSTMTNATVDTSVAGVDGHVITVKYKDGEKKVIVTPQTIIVRYVDGTKDELKAGLRVFINNAIKKPDGTIEAPAVTFGRDVAPPM
jgi:Domain of unknown function (DUF5666)